MYKEYDVMLEAFEEAMQAKIESKLVEYLNRSKRCKQIEQMLNKQTKKDSDLKSSKVSSNLVGNLFSRPSNVSA